MKNLTIALCTLYLITTVAYAYEEPVKPVKRQANTQIQQQKFRHMQENPFEKKLGLTEVQKFKARQQRQAGFEKIRPVMEQIKVKKQEAEIIRNSKLSAQVKEEKLIVIDKELSVLEKQAQEIRKQNMKDFEALLTKEQKKTLKKMKKEGREKFDARQKHMPPPPSQK